MKVWRDGLAPLVSDAGLEALRKALTEDDRRLIQGGTTTPPPLQCVQEWPVEAACAVAFSGWQGDGLATVAEVETYFAKMCFEIDQRLGEPAGCRWFLNFWDETPRAELFRLVLPEVEAVIAARLASQEHSTAVTPA
jgi:hypothetical protein